MKNESQLTTTPHSSGNQRHLSNSQRVGVHKDAQQAVERRNDNRLLLAGSRGNQ